MELIPMAMSKVTIYQYMVLDPERAEKRKSRRWGTREGIQSRKDFAQIIYTCRHRG
jgi:hypothetical protein